MDITKEKSKIFGEIAALRVSAEGYPKELLTSSLQSISQKTNSLSFLTDLHKALIGFESLKDSLVDALTHNLDEIEIDIKKALKKILKSLISCSINPSIPDDFINNGIILEVEKVDFLNMLKIVPSSQAGQLLYDDVNNGSESEDFNTFLYDTIQNNGQSGFWGHVTTNNDILDIAFNPIGLNPSDPNNNLTIKPSAYYSDGTKKLTDLNNDYIDSIKLFNAAKLINNIVDVVFGSISVNVNKDKKTLQDEIQIGDIIDRILNTDEEIIIDNSYFSFSNEEILDIEYRSELRRKGMKMLAMCDNAPSTISIDDLTILNNELIALDSEPPSPQLNEIRTTIVRNGIDMLADSSAEDVDSNNKLTVKISFIEDMLKHLMTAIVNVILSPKLILILAVNHQIIHGESFSSVQDFMKKNKTLMVSVLSTVRDSIVSILMSKVLKEVKKLVTDNIIKTQTERFKNKKAQLSSLTGVPNDILRKISGLTKT
jgi:hypothetical protein